MAQLDAQFYDQLAQRLNKQDDTLERIEQGQNTLLACMSTHKTEDKTNFKWITWVLGGVWAAIAGIVTFLVKH